jgi:hypothetical protein
MKCLARIAVFTALIGGVSLTNAHADGTSVYIAGNIVSDSAGQMSADVYLKEKPGRTRSSLGP